MRKRSRDLVIFRNEIDYDKLAQAIVKAQREAQTVTEEENADTQPSAQVSEEPEEAKETKQTQKRSAKEFRQLVWGIICNKKSSDGTIVSGLMATAIWIAFNGLAIFLVLAFFAIIIYGVYRATQFDWLNDFSLSVLGTIIEIIGSLLCMALFALVFRAAANEIEKEKDRNFVVAVFSGWVSFAALVVACVALIKG